MTALNEVYNDKNMPWDIEQAAAEYHMEKDMTAMAHKIDLLLAENDQLKRQVTEMATTAQIKDAYQDSLESAVRRLGGNAYKNVGNAWNMKEEL